MMDYDMMRVNTTDGKWSTYKLPHGATVEHLPHHVMIVRDVEGERHAWNFRNVISYHLVYVPEDGTEGGSHA